MEQKQSSILWRVTLRTLWRRWNASLLLLAVVVVGFQFVLKAAEKEKDFCCRTIKKAPGP